MLVQSKPLDIIQTLNELEAKGEKGLISGLNRISGFVTLQNIKTYDDFREKADEDLQIIMGHICSRLQDMLKVKGDWEIYPFAVHDLIAQGRVAIDGQDCLHRRQENAGLGIQTGRKQIESHA